jgi:hypothetical protein
MTRAASVTLPAGRRPEFPRRCVVCDREEPGHAATLVANAHLPWWVPFGWFARVLILEVPACPPCAARLRRRYWGRRAACLVLVAGLGAAGYWMVASDTPAGSVRHFLGDLAVGGVASALLVPYALWEILRPLPFDTDPGRGSVEYHFRDARYAREFARLNGAPAPDEPEPPRHGPSG